VKYFTLAIIFFTITRKNISSLFLLFFFFFTLNCNIFLFVVGLLGMQTSRKRTFRNVAETVGLSVYRHCAIKLLDNRILRNALPFLYFAMLVFTLTVELVSHEYNIRSTYIVQQWHITIPQSELSLQSYRLLPGDYMTLSQLLKLGTVEQYTLGCWIGRDVRRKNRSISW